MADDSAMHTLRLIELVLRALEDIIFPAVALWLAYLIRQWIKGRLPVPPHIHEVKVTDELRRP